MLECHRHLFWEKCKTRAEQKKMLSLHGCDTFLSIGNNIRILTAGFGAHTRAGLMNSIFAETGQTNDLRWSHVFQQITFYNIYPDRHSLSFWKQQHLSSFLIRYLKLEPSFLRFAASPIERRINRGLCRFPHDLSEMLVFRKI